MKWIDHCSLFFKSEDLEFEGHKKTNVSKSITYCNDVNGLLEYIKQNIDYLADCTLRSKIGIDSWGGFLKVCLNLDQVENKNLPNKKAKFSYKEGACARIQRLWCEENNNFGHR